MTVDERIEAAVHRAIQIWAICFIAITVFTVITQPLWYIIPLAILGFITYYGSLLLTGIIMAYVIVREGVVEPQITHELELVGRSDEVVGRYMDHDIHEWVDLKIADEVNRYFYDTPAQVINGDIIVPMEDGVAVVNGVIYRTRAEDA